MKIKLFEVKSCCGKSSTLMKLDRSISNEMLEKLTQLGYKQSPIFLKSGILYVDGEDLTLTGSFGSNNLQARCKKENCKEILSNFEEQFKDF